MRLHDYPSRPAPGAGLSRSGHARSIARRRARTLLALGFAAGLVSACGDSEGRWPRHQVEKALFEAQQASARADLQMESGQEVDRQELTAHYAEAIEGFDALRPELQTADSTLINLAVQARLRLAALRGAEEDWSAAVDLYTPLVEDTLYPLQFRHLALMQRGVALERLERWDEATSDFRALVVSFYPPQAEGGVNVEVLSLPRRMMAIARDYMPDSLAGWQAFGEHYYDSIAREFPYTNLATAALGELGKIYAGKEQWPRVIATLERATDTSGNIAPAYWIDIAEVASGRLGDTTRALEILAAVGDKYPESPFRVEADLKRSRIWMERGEYARARETIRLLKEAFEDQPGALIPAQLLYAEAFERSGDWERARAEYSYLVTNFPKSMQAVMAAVATARHYDETQETSSRDEWYNRADALALDLANTGGMNAAAAANVMNLRVSLALERGLWDEAVARLDDLVGAFSVQSPVGALALVHKGWIHLRDRADTAAAGAAWNTLLDAHPDYPLGDTLRAEMSKWPNP